MVKELRFPGTLHMHVLQGYLVRVSSCFHTNDNIAFEYTTYKTAHLV